MKVRQINLKKSKLSLDSINKFIVNDDFDTLYCILEPYWDKNNKVPGVPNLYKVYGTQKSRAIIIAPKHYNLFLCNEFTTLDYTVVLFSDGGKIKRYFASIYLDILLPTISEKMLQISDFFTTNNHDKSYS